MNDVIGSLQLIRFALINQVVEFDERDHQKQSLRTFFFQNLNFF